MKLFNNYFAAALFALSYAGTTTATVTEIKDVAHLDSILKKNPNVVVKFSAEWCGPCKQFAPIYKKVAHELHHKVAFTAVDGDDAKDVVQKYKVRAFPTTLYFKNGKQVKKSSADRTVGAFKAEVKQTFGI